MLVEQQNMDAIFERRLAMTLSMKPNCIVVHQIGHDEEEWIDKGIYHLTVA